MVEQFAPVDECKNQIQLLFRLETELERDDKGAVDLGKHQALRERMRDFVARNNVRLPDRLEGVNTRRVALAHLEDLTEAALTDDRHQLEVVDGERLAVVRLVEDADLDLPGAADKVVPLVLVAHSIEVGHELESPEEDVITEVVREAVAAALRFLRANVALQGDLGVARHVAAHAL